MRHRLLSTSYRRRLLDRDLMEACASLHGLVLDLGGEWQQRRGTFRPPQRADLRWLCVNLDLAVAPDVAADIAHVPLANGCADAVICTEALEHVPFPEAVLAEAQRLLRPDGQLILSMPFLFPVHADPHDYQRYTKFKLEQLLREAGFTAVEILPQGLYFTVLTDMIRSGLARLRPTLLRWVAAAIFLPLAYWLRWWESRNTSSPFITSYPEGYFVIARE